MQHNVAARNRLIPDSTMDWRQVLDDLRGHGQRMAPWVTDVSLFLAARARGRTRRSCSKARRARCSTSITAPIRTSPRRTRPIGGVCTGLGVGPRAIDTVLGVAKAYTTRVGEGPLPTELTGEIGNRLRETGKEFGAVTGRPRRCGWYDAVAVRYAVRVNGLDALALTKLDVLDGLPELQVCTAYRCNGKVLTEMPGDPAQLAACEPVYETLPGWTAPTRGPRALRRPAARGACLRRAAREDHGRACRDRIDWFRTARDDSAGRRSRSRARDSLDGHSLSFEQ